LYAGRHSTVVRLVADRRRNPFDMSPPCDRFVPGYGDANADFHVVGDHPGVHGGEASQIPFTDRAWSAAFLAALAEAKLLESADLDDGELAVATTYLSYLHQCVPTGREPTDADYAALEPYFDAELRAITADVLVPVGRRATAHVLGEYTARDPALAGDLDAIHGTELLGSGWLIVPVKEPAEWSEGDADRLVAGLAELQETDYHRIADLGRFMAGHEPYFVR
jgi:uracil-DNA glycosylase family 4